MLSLALVENDLKKLKAIKYKKLRILITPLYDLKIIQRRQL